ncbi:MAG: hypothetical protein O7F73_05370 [Gammaproteobacteria bacterium]|nr:hypothetical protein [Gammaproteobacteria bacterium]
MHKFYTVCFFLISLLATTVLQAGAAAAGAATAAETSTFPGVQKLMSEQEFSASGLHKLSPEEIRALNQWLIRYTAGEAQILITTDEEVMEADRNQEILSSVKQPFRGWSGNTVFRLENGQVWQQRRRGNYYHNGADTRVSITKNFMGFYKMTLLGSGKSVQVTRLE